MMKKEVLYLLVLLLFASCKIDDAEYLERDELGVDSKEVTIGSDIGRLKLNVYSNKKGSVRVLEGNSWLKALDSSFEGDATISLDYLYNDGFPRLGLVELRTDTRCDSITVKQKGSVEESLLFPQTSIVVYNSKDKTAIPIEGNVDVGSIQSSVTYIDGEGWISDLKLLPTSMQFKTVKNPDLSKSRKARIRLSYIDGWHDERAFTIYITQAPSTDILGETLSFEQIRALDPGTISDDYCLEGYVVSRPESGNMGENAVLSMNYIDYDADKETAYVESLDGNYGFRLRCVSDKENVFRPDTYVRVLLNGATLIKESNPERYSLTGVAASMVLEAVNAAEGAIPLKMMRMSDLKDSDIYTYVTLQSCEIPVRKGCLTPINEGYTFLFNSDRVSKFPILIRDIEGSSMYMYTNTTCPYRRDGRKLPYGKGSISGIIVHEKYRSFIDRDNPDEDLCGNIGRYQIRHTRYEDLALEDDIEGSFSALLTEYRYMNIPPLNPDHIWLPTYGENGHFSHSRTAYVQADYKTHGWPSTDFTYLGPCGNNNKNNVNGFGIILEDGTDYGKGLTANTDGKGASTSELKSAWSNTQWWFNDRPEAWLIDFSTEGIESDVVSMQLSTHNTAQGLLTPRYWKAEWSLSGNMSASADSQWHLIAEYVVPDVGINSNTLLNQSLGFKQMDFPLPKEILGHEKVYIRLMPSRNAASSGKEEDYDSSKIKNGNHNSINYFAIRYNK